MVNTHFFLCARLVQTIGVKNFSKVCFNPMVEKFEQTENYVVNLCNVCQFKTLLLLNYVLSLIQILYTYIMFVNSKCTMSQTEHSSRIISRTNCFVTPVSILSMNIQGYLGNFVVFLATFDMETTIFNRLYHCSTCM